MSEPDPSTPTPAEVVAALRETAEFLDAPFVDLTDTARLQSLCERLNDLNSRFPATREFLAARGLTHANQLDEAGRAALTRHLEATLATLTK